MAVNDQRNTGNTQMADALNQARSTQQQPAGQARGQQQAAQPNGPTSTGGFGTQQPQSVGFGSLGRLLPLPMTRNPMSEVLHKLQGSIEEQLKENIRMEDFDVTLLPIDVSEAPRALAMSVLVVVGQDRSHRDLGIAYHVLMVEGSVEPYGAVFPNIPGVGNVEVIRTACDANDKNMVDVVLDRLQRHFPNTMVYSADAEVVPRDFNVEDQNAVRTLTANAVIAVAHELQQRRPTFKDVNIARIANKDEVLTVSVNFNKDQQRFVDEVGKPLRSDIIIDLRSDPANRNPGNLNQPLPVAAPEPVSTLAGFIDLIYSPEGNVQNPFGSWGVPQQPQFGQQMRHIYTARLVLTYMQTRAISTPSAQLLALVNAMALNEGNAWVRAFQPQTALSNEVDIHDIGAINIEANVEQNPNGGARVDTRAENFKYPQSLFSLVAATIRPGLMISIDVEKCGPAVWYNGIFAAAAGGDANANAALIRAANDLTDGKFANHFPENGRCCYTESNLIHMGYYFDNHGVKRDLREIDYLAVMNLVGDRDPKVIQDWSDTFNRDDYPLEQRLAERKRIISALVPSAVFTGFAYRVTFDAAFMRALVLGCQDVGLDVRTTTPYTDHMVYERAGASFVQQGLLTPGASGLFNRGGFGTGYNNPSAGRWQNADAGFSARW